MKPWQNFVIAVVVMVTGSVADAQTYTTNFNGQLQGSPTTTKVGQLFTAPGGSLQSLTFTDSDNSLDGGRLVISAFDTSTFAPIGPELYSAALSVTTPDARFAVQDDDGNPTGDFYAYTHLFGGINTALTAGQRYYAYLDLSSPAASGDTSFSGTFFFNAASVKNSTLGGELVFQDGGTYRYIPGNAYQPDPFQAEYIMTYGPTISAVPEPASWALMIVGVGLVGGVTRRRRLVRTALAA